MATGWPCQTQRRALCFTDCRIRAGTDAKIPASTDFFVRMFVPLLCRWRSSSQKLRRGQGLVIVVESQHFYLAGFNFPCLGRLGPALLVPVL